MVLLRVLGDLSHEEIAEVLGKSAMAVRVSYHRGIKALRNALDPPPAVESGSRAEVAAQPDATL